MHTPRAEVIAQKRQQSGYTECILASGRSLGVSKLLGAHVSAGDEIWFLLTPQGQAPTAPELLVKRNRGTYIYQAPIGYAALPKSDKFQHPYVPAEIATGTLGFTGLHLTCAAIRDYFYFDVRDGRSKSQATLYEVLRAPPTASLADLRLAFKLRELELLASNSPVPEHRRLERAFNLLAAPDLRVCYDGLLAEPKSPVLFPYAGFGLILVLGSPMKERFFARQILSFIPERRKRRFKLPLRKLTFYPDRAVYRNSRAKLQVTFDPILLPVGFDPDWNRWKHLLGATVEVQAEFVRTGQYGRQGDQWKLATWEEALASRIRVTIPDNLAELIGTARHMYQRFGRYSDWVEAMRGRLEKTPMERTELERLGAAEGVPADFDVAQINWQPDYDPFYYQELSRLSNRLFLFRGEYLFVTRNLVLVETPQAGHATYLFSIPCNLDQFLRLYACTSKEAIRNNRANCAEQLGYLGRVAHGEDPKRWKADLERWLAG